VENREKKRRTDTIRIYAQSKKRRGTTEENDAETKGWKITIEGCDTKDSGTYVNETEVEMVRGRFERQRVRWRTGSKKDEQKQ
jgi:hypothetical protein